MSRSRTPAPTTTTTRWRRLSDELATVATSLDEGRVSPEQAAHRIGRLVVLEALALGAHEPVPGDDELPTPAWLREGEP